MGIDISSVLMYGVDYEDIYEAYVSEAEEDEDGELTPHFYDWYEDKGLTRASPWYGSPVDYCCFGFYVSTGELEKVISGLREAKEKWDKMFPTFKGRVIQSPDVY